jgi:hypothetical protein
MTFNRIRLHAMGAGILTLLALATSLPLLAQSTVDQNEQLAYDPSVCSGAVFSRQLSPDCLEMIEVHPAPDFEKIPQDRHTLSTYSFWRVGPGATPTFSAPGGSVSGEIPAGYNFVNAIDQSVEGWIQIEGGQWIRRSDGTLSTPSTFQGVKLPENWEHPFAWVLDLSFTYVSEYPDGPASQETGRFLERYEMVWIYAIATDAEGWNWYMIGPNQWVKQTFVSKVEPLDEMPEGVSGRWVSVDLYEQTLIAYEDDRPVFATLIASGIPPHETNEGLFTVWARVARDGMSGATGAPDAYALQSVPWVMYFDDSISLHGTYWHNYFGYRQSHGCVNLTISDARFLYHWMMESEPNEDGELENYVYVHSSGVYGENVIRS